MELVECQARVLLSAFLLTCNLGASEATHLLLVSSAAPINAKVSKTRDRR